jgi:hypothetical protein
LEGLPIADQALIQALRAWHVDADAAFWGRFERRRAARLKDVWDHVAHSRPEHALEALRRAHGAQARPDLRRVHPSWWLRGLREESAAVRRAVVASVPPEWRETLRQGLGLTESDLATDLAPQPEALGWVAALWTERLVGDMADRDDDPPAIRVLTHRSARSSARLVQATGLAKWAVSRAEPPPLSGREASRFRAFRDSLSAWPDRWNDQADRDVAAAGKDRHVLARLGAVTLARLLTQTDPYRARWALQHVPYAAAKAVRALMPARVGPNPAWVAWETQVLRLAWERLQSEGLWPWRWEAVA